MGMTSTIPVEVAARSVDVPLLDQAEEYFRGGQRELARDIVEYHFTMRYWAAPDPEKVAAVETAELIEMWRLTYDNR